MATNTDILGLTKPAYNDDADVSVINANMDLIDAEAGRLRGNFAGTYDATASYAVGDYCIYSGDLYRCTTAISGGEAWTAGHWNQVTVGSELPQKVTSDVSNTAYTSGNLNDLPDGMHRVYDSITNIPEAISGYCLCVRREDGTKMQTYTTDTNNTYTRTKSSGTWGSWKKLASNDLIATYNDNGISKTLTSGDLNNIKTPGRYYATSDVSNLPFSGASGYLDVYVYDSNRVAQTFRHFNNDNVYERKLLAGSWTSWSSINDRLKTVYTSTVSFQAIDPYIKTAATYLGGALDEDVHGVIGSIPDGMSMRILSRGGPVYSCIMNKTSNSYYCGLAWGYHDSAKYTVWLFAYINGTFMLRPMAQELNSI